MLVYFNFWNNIFSKNKLYGGNCTVIVVLCDDGDHPRVVGRAKAAHEDAQARGFACHERDARWGHARSFAPGVRGAQQFLGKEAFL